MKVGSRVEIVNTDYNPVQDEFLANGEQGVVVKVFQSGLLIVNMDNCKDPLRNGWSFYQYQLMEI